VPAPWTIVGVGDFDGNGKSDLLWRNLSTGQNSIWLLDSNQVQSGSGLITEIADLNWKVAGVADFNGDGRSDILWRNDVIGQSSVWLMNGGTTGAGSGSTFLQMNSSYRAAAVGDFDGDGKADIIWRHTSTGQNIMWLMDGTNTLAGSGEMPAVPDTAWSAVASGDFNGDGREDIIWRNDTTGDTSVWMLNGATFASGSGYFGTIPAPWQVVGPK
jgi:hypothetical protein